MALLGWKTQLGFALKEDVIYIVYQTIRQHIYNCFTQFSEYFVSCISRDTAILTGDLSAKSKSCTECVKLSQRKFWTTSFFDLVLQQQWDPDTKQRLSPTVSHASGTPVQQDASASSSSVSSYSCAYPNKLPYSLVGKNFDAVITRTMSHNDFLRKWSWLIDSTSSRFVVFIDEILGREEEKELAFMRNLCRSLGLTVILSGTNSRAANMLLAPESRNGAPPYVWCHLFSRPSQPTPQSLKASRVTDYDDIAAKCAAIDLHIACFVQDCSTSCRGYFVVSMLQTLAALMKKRQDDPLLPKYSPCQILDDLFVHLHNKVHLEKLSLFQTEVGQAGQILIYFSDRVTSDFVAQHFAHLCLERKSPATSGASASSTTSAVASWDPFIFWCNGGHLVEDSFLTDMPIDCHCFRPDDKIAVFPSLHEEPLLFLSLCGNMQTRSPFLNEREEGLPLCVAWSNRTLQSHLEAPFSTKNPNSQRSDGTILEQYTGVAISVASQRNGFSGQGIFEFLDTLIFHLYGNVENIPILKQNIVLPGHLQRATIPFLCATNDRFPPSLCSIPGVRVASLVRPVDSSEIDMEGGGLVVEAKDWQKAFDSTKVTEVLAKFRQRQGQLIQYPTAYPPVLGLIFLQTMNKNAYELPSECPVYQVRLSNNNQVECFPAHTGIPRAISPTPTTAKNTLSEPSSPTPRRQPTDPDFHGICIMFELGNVKGLLPRSTAAASYRAAYSS
ncbi:hypothetical protein Pelo_12043 [Pelomyxa schiedti]|nr:hypothetical protein Pelo_12043 [Pelomyxa schiedti]